MSSVAFAAQVGGRHALEIDVLVSRGLQWCRAERVCNSKHHRLVKAMAWQLVVRLPGQRQLASALRGDTKAVPRVETQRWRHADPIVEAQHSG